MDDFSIQWRITDRQPGWDSFESACHCPICGQLVSLTYHVSHRWRVEPNAEGLTLARDFIRSLEQTFAVLKRHIQEDHPDA